MWYKSEFEEQNVTMFSFSPCLYVWSIALLEYCTELVQLLEDWLYESLTINKMV